MQKQEHFGINLFLISPLVNVIKNIYSSLTTCTLLEWEISNASTALHFEGKHCAPLYLFYLFIYYYLLIFSY